MTFVRSLAIAAAVAVLSPVLTATPAAAQATPTEAAASKYVVDLSERVFGVLRDKSMSKQQVRARFKTMLTENFALDEIGDRLIRRYRSQITPAQYAAYQSALPQFAINAYTDRLFSYAEATVSPVRTLPRGTKGDIDVYTKVTKPGSKPFDAIWQVRPAGGSFKVLNLTLSGINLSLTQEADFSGYIAKNGFDALVTFMKSSNAKAAT